MHDRKLHKQYFFFFAKLDKQLFCYTKRKQKKTSRILFSFVAFIVSLSAGKT